MEQELIRKLVDRMGDDIAEVIVRKTIELQQQLELPDVQRLPLARILSKLACELITRTAELYSEIVTEEQR